MYRELTLVVTSASVSESALNPRLVGSRRKIRVGVSVLVRLSKKAGAVTGAYDTTISA